MPQLDLMIYATQFVGILFVVFVGHVLSLLVLQQLVYGLGVRNFDLFFFLEVPEFWTVLKLQLVEVLVWPTHCATEAFYNNLLTYVYYNASV